MKHDRTYYRGLSWETLKRFVKYGDSGTNWQELAVALVEVADREMEDAYDRGRGDGSY